MKLITACAAVLLFATLADAGTFKCVGKDGSIMYQGSPCDGAVQSSKQLQAPEAPAPPPHVAAGKKPSDQFFEDRFNKGDYAGALNFATTEQQRSRAAAKKAQQDRECKIKKIRAEQARANSRSLGGRQQHAAEAAEAIYATSCKYAR